MKMQTLDAIITEEGGQFIALCVQYGVVSQGNSIRHALKMLTEAVELFLENNTKTHPVHMVGLKKFRVAA